MTPRPNDPRIFTTGEAADLAQVKASDIEFWSKSGLLRPQQDGEGRGFHRWWVTDEIIFMIVIREFTRLGLSIPQLQQAFSVWRTKLAKTPEEFRRAALVHDYIESMKLWAGFFGSTPAFKEWLPKANACHARLRREAETRAAASRAKTNAERDAAVAARMRELLASLSALPEPGITVRASQR